MNRELSKVVQFGTDIRAKLYTTTIDHEHGLVSVVVWRIKTVDVTNSVLHIQYGDDRLGTLIPFSSHEKARAAFDQVNAAIEDWSRIESFPSFFRMVDDHKFVLNSLKASLKTLQMDEEE